MARPEILFLAHRIPYPPNKGDKIRSWRTLKHLAESYEVHLCAFVDDPDDMRHRGVVEGVCKSVSLVSLSPLQAKLRSMTSLFSGEPLSFGYYRDRAMKRAVAKVQESGLAFQYAFSSTMAPYMEQHAAPCFVDLCDADSEKWHQYSNDASFPMAQIYKREAKTLARYESEMINQASASFAISPDEAKILQRTDVHKEVHWFGNGVDTEFFNPDADFSENEIKADVVFVGAMDYRANVDAILWFVDEVWPKVRAQHASARFAIVGSNPSRSILSLADHKDIIVTDRVADVRPYIAAAKAVIAPMRVARGVQNKVLEAMAMAAPVVATAAAAEGLAVAEGEDYLRADTPEAFAEKVSSLLNNEEEQRRLGNNARRTVLEAYRWKAQLTRLDQVIDNHLCART